MVLPRKTIRFHFSISAWDVNLAVHFANYRFAYAKHSFLAAKNSLSALIDFCFVGVAWDAYRLEGPRLARASDEENWPFFFAHPSGKIA